MRMVSQGSTGPTANTQPLTIAQIHEIFRNLESGDGKGFFDHVADDVDWIVEGTRPLDSTLVARLFKENPI